jgi:hypothetical protein
VFHSGIVLQKKEYLYKYFLRICDSMYEVKIFWYDGECQYMILQLSCLLFCKIQYNLVKPPPSVQPDFGDKLSKDRKPEVNSLILNLK